MTSSIFAKGKTVKENDKSLQGSIVYLEDNIDYIDNQIKYIDDNIIYLKDHIKYLDNQIKYLDDGIVYLEDHIKYLDESIKVVEVYDYGSQAYYDSINTFNILYSNIADVRDDLLKVGGVVVAATLVIGTAGGGGFLVPLLGLENGAALTVGTVAKVSASKFGTAILQSVSAGSISGACGYVVNYIKKGEVSSGEIVEWASEGVKWMAFFQEVEVLKGITNSVVSINTSDRPLQMLDGSSSSTTINAKNSGKLVKLEKVPRGVKASSARKIAHNIGIKVSDDGYPNFKPYAKGIFKSKTMLLGDSSSNSSDFVAADKTLGISRAFRQNHKLTWHHGEDGYTMYLVPTDLHNAYRHRGGASLIRQFNSILNR